jgi:hypothetical protein
MGTEPEVEKNEGKKSTHNKGHDFEKKVAKWAKRYFDATEVQTNILVNGLRVKRPYEVDVHVYKKKLLSQSDIWVECKDISSSIRRTHIFKLLSSAQDVEDAHHEGREEFYFDRLVFVSSSNFDTDALSYADENDIACFHYDGKKYVLKNNPSWVY